jgi:hypothetical protein
MAKRSGYASRKPSTPKKKTEPEPEDIREVDKASFVESLLPDVEEVSELVHAAWMEAKLAEGIQTRQSEDGEELMVPYPQLSEKAKEQDRVSVRAVYAAIRAALDKNDAVDDDDDDDDDKDNE